MVASPTLGFLGNRLRGVRFIGIATSIVFVGANVLYSILSVFPTADWRFSALLVSRFLTGATSGAGLI